MLEGRLGRRDHREADLMRRARNLLRGVRQDVFDRAGAAQPLLDVGANRRSRNGCAAQARSRT